MINKHIPFNERVVRFIGLAVALGFVFYSDYKLEGIAFILVIINANISSLVNHDDE